MKIWLLVIGFFATHAVAQKNSFKEIKCKPNPKFHAVNEETITYPVLVTGNKQTELAVNNTIKNKVLNSKAGKLNTATLLQQQINDGLISMSYAVTLNKGKFLSLNISSETCGAYCSLWTAWFNFDLLTGKTLSVRDIVVPAKIDSLRQIVFKDKQNFIVAYKKELEQNLASKEIDSSAYRWAMDQVNDYCIRTVQLDDFALLDNGIEFIDPCEFPHAIRFLQPSYRLQYNYADIKIFLRPSFVNFMLVKVK